MEQGNKKLSIGITVGSILVGILILIFIVDKIQKMLQGGQLRRDTKQEIDALQDQGLQATYLDSWYSTQADRLYSAMKSDWWNPVTWGTDESTIKTVFGALMNDIDFIKLQTAFGDKEGYNMFQWLDGDLDSYDKQAINQSLASKGITKRV
jgi:hypothetical protein